MAVEAELRRVPPGRMLDEWRSLFDADPAATPFASAEWARAWWPHWAGSAEPWLVVVRDEGELVGLAPLVLTRRGPFRVLAELGRDPSNYWDVLSRPGSREEVVTAVAAELHRRANEWDALVLPGLPLPSPTGVILEAAGLRVDRREPVPYPGIELPGSFDEYLAGLPRQRRHNLRRHLRRLDEGEIALRVVSDPGELAEAVSRWQALRVRWWQGREKGMDPEHGTDRFRRFMTDLTRRLVPRGMAEVWEFHAGGEPVGVEISLTDARTFYQWLGGYDPGSAQLGLGKLAIAYGIRSSIEAGRGYFDFMVGDEPHKYWYGASDRHCQRVICTTGRPRSRAARRANALLERIRGG